MSFHICVYLPLTPLKKDNNNKPVLCVSPENCHSLFQDQFPTSTATTSLI